MKWPNVNVKSSLIFTALPSARVKEAFSILTAVGQYIVAQGRKQRIAKLSFELYHHWYLENTNYIVLEHDVIIGLVTLRLERLLDWPNQMKARKSQPAWMIRALATHPEHRGKGVGVFAVGEIEKMVAAMERQPSIFLDCVSDFLPDYYSQLGYEFVEQQTKTYPDAECYDITLMKKELVKTRSTSISQV